MLLLALYRVFKSKELLSFNVVRRSATNAKVFVAFQGECVGHGPGDEPLGWGWKFRSLCLDPFLFLRSYHLSFLLASFLRVDER